MCTDLKRKVNFIFNYIFKLKITAYFLLPALNHTTDIVTLNHHYQFEVTCNATRWPCVFDSLFDILLIIIKINAPGVPLVLLIHYPSQW